MSERRRRNVQGCRNRGENREGEEEEERKKRCRKKRGLTDSGKAGGEEGKAWRATKVNHG